MFLEREWRACKCLRALVRTKGSSRCLKTHRDKVVHHRQGFGPHIIVVKKRKLFQQPFVVSLAQASCACRCGKELG